MNEWHHYAVCDPRIADAILSVRYVGRTIKDLKVRLGEHCSKARRGYPDHRSRWIRKLLAEGVTPVIASLGVGGEGAESEWIALYRARGADLTNSTDGGDGVLNMSMDAKGRQRAAMAVTYATPEYQDRKLAGLRAANARPEVKQARLTAAKIRSSSPEVRARISAGVKAAWARPETAARIRSAAEASRRSPEYKAALAAAMASPERRARASAASKEFHSRPEVKAKHSAALKAAWAKRKIGALNTEASDGRAS